MTAREDLLIECLFRGYQTLGFDSDGCRTGAEFLAHAGLHGNNLEAFIEIMDRAFRESRADQEEADSRCCCGVCGL